MLIDSAARFMVGAGGHAFAMWDSGLPFGHGRGFGQSVMPDGANIGRYRYEKEKANPCI